MVPRLYNTISFILICWAILIVKPNVLAQDQNTARISIITGSNVSFNFSTIAKIKTGYTLTDYTTLGISLTSLYVPGHDLQGFELYFSSNGSPNLQGEVHTIPLSKLSVSAVKLNGLVAGVSVSEGYKTLTAGNVKLFSYTIAPAVWTLADDLVGQTDQLSISYQCSPLLGEESDYFNVEIAFELWPIGAGF